MSSLVRLDDLFYVHRARSGLFDEYDPGRVAFISNTADTNGVVGFVDPQEGDTVFDFTAVVVNAFSRAPRSVGARLQTAPFVACGRSGNGLLILEPKEPMKLGQLAYMAAYLNRVHGWRFTWYRQTTKDRLSSLKVPGEPAAIRFPVADLMPEATEQRVISPRLRFRPVTLATLFDLRPGDYHAESDLLPGTIPLVSCGDENNGVVSFVDVPEDGLYRHQLTIALNGRPLTTKYHPYRFAAKDDVAVATPLKSLRLTTLLVVQAMLNRSSLNFSGSAELSIADALSAARATS